MYTKIYMYTLKGCRLDTDKHQDHRGPTDKKASV